MPVAALSATRAGALTDVPQTRSLELLGTHTGERLAVEYFAAGEYRDEALEALGRLLRDHRTGETAAIDRRLFDLLHELAARAGREPRFEVISGYRSAQTNAMLNARSAGVSTRSLHMEGRAVDVRLVGFATARLRDLALAAATGGVGYYRAEDFVHLDTGRIRSWTG